MLCGICVVLDSVSGGDGERDVVHGSSGSSNEKRRASYRPTRTAPPRERTRWEGLLSAEKVACEDKECHRYEIHEMFQGNLGRISQQNRLVLILFRNGGKVVAIGEGSWSSVSPEVRSVRKSNLEYSLQFSFLIMMTIISYLKGHMTDPGGPRDWVKQYN